MPRVQFIGQIAQAPAGQRLWQPGEERDVSQGEADDLARNANWRLADDAALDTPTNEPTVVPRAPIVAPPVAATPEDPATPDAQQGG